VYALTRLNVRLTVFAVKKNAVSLEGTAITSSTQTIILERLEGLALLAASVITFAITAPNWILFAVLLLSPDLAMLGYLRGSRIGAIAYNLAHLKILPLALGSIGLLTSNTLEIQLALIWFAHIGMDRALGYGLKLETGFSDTTLGKIRQRSKENLTRPAH
jgi:Domain of unknown function (DUF4260)